MSEFFDRKAVGGWVLDLLPCLRCGAMVHANLFAEHEAFHGALDDATAGDAR